MRIFEGGQQITVPGVTKIDCASSTITYMGEARPGSADAWACWSIKRLTFDDAGGLLKIEWADKGQFTSPWTNRASLQYS